MSTAVEGMDLFLDDQYHLLTLSLAALSCQASCSVSSSNSRLGVVDKAFDMTTI